MSRQSFQKSLFIIHEMLQYRKANDPEQYTGPCAELEEYLKGHRYIHTVSELNENLVVLDFDSIRLIFNLDTKWDPVSITGRFKQPIIEGTSTSGDDTLEDYKRHKGSPSLKRIICVLSHSHAKNKSMDKKDRGGGPSNRDTLSFISSLGIKGEIFHIQDLQYNVTRHILVPCHQIVKDKEEIERIKKDYQVNDLRLLPLILNSDPVVKFIGGQSNDLIKIVRNPDHVGEHVLYRFCVGGRG